ncbi:YxeA family protein [Lactococcus petauri]|uniref:YxeA family protein n=1 Tax=Lactococcus petauri TaxID=1940789 RepID=UPI003853689E
MKKILLAFVAGILLLIGGTYTWYRIQTAGEIYYVQIKEDGQKKIERFNNGEQFENYYYNLTGYNDKGEAKKLNYTAGHNLKHGAFLKITYNNKRGVINWEEIQKKDIPQNVLDKFQAYR